jgi:ABC-type Fe3+ transport system substrate-binding protein
MKRLKLITVGVLASLTLAACGSSGSNFAEEGSDSGSTYLDGLYDEAKKANDTKLTIYTAFPPVLEPLLKAFEKKFPGIKTSTVAIAGPPMHSRLAAEAKSGVKADVVFLATTDTIALKDSDLFQPFLPENAKELPAEFRGPNDEYLAALAQMSVLPYNTKSIKKAPTSWGELSDATFAGKIGAGDLTTITAGTPLTLAVMYIKGVIDDDWLRSVARLKPTQFPSTGAVIQAVSNGQVSLALPQGNPSVVAAESQGAPIKRAILSEGMASFGLPSAITKGAPNDKAAELFQAYMLSPEAQASFAAGGASPTMPGSPDPKGLEGAKLLVLSNDEVLNDLQPTLKKISDAFNG